jgi:hypothetical protein
MIKKIGEEEGQRSELKRGAGSKARPSKKSEANDPVLLLGGY